MHHFCPLTFCPNFYPPCKLQQEILIKFLSRQSFFEVPKFIGRFYFCLSYLLQLSTAMAPDEVGRANTWVKATVMSRNVAVCPWKNNRNDFCLLCKPDALTWDTQSHRFLVFSAPASPVGANPSFHWAHCVVHPEQLLLWMFIMHAVMYLSRFMAVHWNTFWWLWSELGWWPNPGRWNPRKHKGCGKKRVPRCYHVEITLPPCSQAAWPTSGVGSAPPKNINPHLAVAQATLTAACFCASNWRTAAGWAGLLFCLKQSVQLVKCSVWLSGPARLAETCCFYCLL